MFVENLSDIVKNIKTLEEYRKSASKIKNSYYKQRIRLGNSFVVIEAKERYYFAPSRFAGYRENDMAKHDREERNGGTSNLVIDKILGKHERDMTVEARFLEFCRENDIEPAKKERKYWKVQKLPNLAF